MRYALIIPILYAIVIGSHIIWFYSKYESKNLHKALLVFEKYWLLQLVNSIVYLSLNINMSIIDNYQLLLIDRNINKIDIDGVFGSINENVGYTSILRKEGIPIYNIRQKEFETNEYTLTMYKKIFKDQKVYVLVLYSYSSSYEEYFKKNNFKYKIIKKYNSYEIPVLKKMIYYIYMNSINMIKIRPQFI